MTAIDDVAAESEVQPATTRVWDPVIRIFHWTLVVAFAISWLTGDEVKSVHLASGYVIIGLLSVRLLWGLVGTKHARFTDFIYRPSTVAAYLRDIVRLRARRYLGHNPAGGAMILVLLSGLVVACATGFMMTTDAYWGVEWVEDVHEAAANILILLVGLHLAGVAVASFEHRENLVKAMITGRKRL
ncbi:MULTISPECIES: cytochrome b/b6 domain-containing protein [Inquilinus]|uniref:Cytochrome b n=1 Tax=Inquilinus ginsengisoli TaxID=363840 RepID=A0ABU1JHV2_9PROT|nr:cytochrome b/b6 domain-containing protein [Inquilinus ginsengisoli]MDR6288146.1 cytochrome b [Inquilinus ginsengisoli]